MHMHRKIRELILSDTRGGERRRENASTTTTTTKSDRGEEKKGASIFPFALTVAIFGASRSVALPPPLPEFIPDPCLAPPAPVPEGTRSRFRRRRGAADAKCPRGWRGAAVLIPSAAAVAVAGDPANRGG
ncbi:hypothetical protein NL676_012102 [Syzygium grande]|nr:hypothetical protein NL676_012102 [Syzygium grande]